MSQYPGRLLSFGTNPKKHDIVIPLEEHEGHEYFFLLDPDSGDLSFHSKGTSSDGPSTHSIIGLETGRTKILRFGKGSMFSFGVQWSQKHRPDYDSESQALWSRIAAAKRIEAASLKNVFSLKSFTSVGNPAVLGDIYTSTEHMLFEKTMRVYAVKEQLPVPKDRGASPDVAKGRLNRECAIHKALLGKSDNIIKFHMLIGREPNNLDNVVIDALVFDAYPLNLETLIVSSIPHNAPPPMHNAPPPMHNCSRPPSKPRKSFAEDLLLDCLRGLKALHESRIVHNNIRPSSIMVRVVPGPGPDNFPKYSFSLGGFGFAQIIASGETGGLGPFAMDQDDSYFHAPENAMGLVASNSDVWSLGVLMAKVLRLTCEREYRHESEKWFDKIQSLVKDGHIPTSAVRYSEYPQLIEFGPILSATTDSDRARETRHTIVRWGRRMAWLGEQKDFLPSFFKYMLVIDHVERYNAAECLQKVNWYIEKKLLWTGTWVGNLGVEEVKVAKGNGPQMIDGANFYPSY
ncbi:kinase-like domain-containing protein [Lasiosphaeria ovina]|uniref:Kinase-like domain-containing protein n=1 Tax=Lasiosphaeria ovina TaxID=92902 RepID=A0AAE0MZM7_9PEZI|nr:kinase-like domain-containing protein [Lasiosphaeria ovina]